MTTLSELVKLKNSIEEKLNSINFDQHIDNVCYTLSLVKTENPEITENIVNEEIHNIILKYKELSKTTNTINNDLRNVLDYLNNQINLTSIAINQRFLENRPNSSYINSNLAHPLQTFHLSTATNHLITSSITKYADWHYPLLRLGCTYVGQDNLTQNGQAIIDYSKSIEYSNLLVAGDPLYFCDTKQEHIDSVTSHFNEVYSRRIRKYVIKDYDLSELPQNQFGFIFCWMFFNFLNFATIESYLQNLIKLLRPGGVLMFSYNNIEVYESAIISENNIMTAISKKKLVELLKNIGFEIIEHHDIPNKDFFIKNISYMEIKKPGNLQSIKLKQVLGQILEK